MTDKTTPEHHAEAILRNLDRAIERIMGVEIEAMGGDNLAVVLCSHFDDDDGSEPDDCGWSQTAVNAYEEIKQEIAGKFVPVREAILSAVREAMEPKWLPITDEVKDGRGVLVWRDDWDEPVIARWVCCYDFLTETEIESSGLDDEALAQCDWLSADFMQGCRLENDTAPTHYQPLPTPPRGEALSELIASTADQYGDTER